ncbi:gamma carbonic anhydrase [Ferviditalea candida]|uniref:Gamma carbonic anhydrase family protein n=1 Tax=Ferviditalea candida TaxID=3108399 RepID=A0ABU5ZC03_9BACL|nr:gamma carbonic anhydrase family protein [Paenibacillaceae bacterium T2]
MFPYYEHMPEVHPSVFLAPGSVVTGDVKIGEDSGVWYNAVIRGDVAPTIIGQRVNIQDNSTLHQSPGNPLIIEDEVTVGHNVILHSCRIGKGSLIGMGSIILDRAEIGEFTLIGAGSLVPPGKKIPSRHLALGNPVAVVRPLEQKDLDYLKRAVQSYVDKAKYYKNLHLKK